MPNLTLTDYANAALDAGYRKTAGPLLQQAMNLSKSARLQKALKDLDDEAARLEAEGKRMDADNPVLKIALQEYAAMMQTVSQLITANDDAIQASGQSVAIPVVTSKLFPAITNEIVRGGTNPVSPAAVKAYREALKSAGLI